MIGAGLVSICSALNAPLGKFTTFPVCTIHWSANLGTGNADLVAFLQYIKPRPGCNRAHKSSNVFERGIANALEGGVQPEPAWISDSETDTWIGTSALCQESDLMWSLGVDGGRQFNAFTQNRCD
jgi:hypothetical protein